MTMCCTQRGSHWFPPSLPKLLLLALCAGAPLGSASAQLAINSGDEVEVLVERAEVRTGPTLVATVEVGDRFRVLRSFDKWVRVSPAGREGWLELTAIRRVPSIDIGDQVRLSSGSVTLEGDAGPLTVRGGERLAVVRTPIDGQLTVAKDGRLGTIDASRVTRVTLDGTELEREHGSHTAIFDKAVAAKDVATAGREAMQIVALKRDVLERVRKERPNDATLARNIRTGIASFGEFAGGRLRDLEELDSELAMRRLVVSMRRTVHGQSDWQTAAALAEYRYARQLADADPERRAELRAADRQHGRADTLLRARDYLAAANVLSENLVERKRLLGDSHLLVAVTANNLAFAHDQLNQHEKAAPMYRESLAIVGETLGKQHPEYATRLCNLGQLHADDGDFEQAIPLLTECLSIRERTLGRTNSAVQGTMRSLADVYEKSGDPNRAAAMRTRLKSSSNGS